MIYRLDYLLRFGARKSHCRHSVGRFNRKRVCVHNRRLVIVIGSKYKKRRMHRDNLFQFRHVISIVDHYRMSQHSHFVIRNDAKRLRRQLDIGEN